MPINKWKQFHSDNKENDALSGYKENFTSVIKNATPVAREKILRELIGSIMEKLETKGMPPRLSRDDDYGKFIGGVGYFLHKELETKSAEELIKLKDLLVDNVHWKNNLGGGMTPSHEWALTKQDFKTAVNSTLIEYAKQLPNAPQSTNQPQESQNDEQKEITTNYPKR